MAAAGRRWRVSRRCAPIRSRSPGRSSATPRATGSRDPTTAGWRSGSPPPGCSAAATSADRSGLRGDVGQLPQIGRRIAVVWGHTRHPRHLRHHRGILPRRHPVPTVCYVEQALRVADALPPGEEQVERSEKALAMAEQLDDFTLLVQARINLVAADEPAAPRDREIPHIAWLLGCLEGEPGGRDQVTDRQRFEILWECRYALARTRRSS